jgi:hypothetical protein
MTQQDQYNITDLLGFPLKRDEKDTLAQTYFELILTRFFSEKLPEVVTREQVFTLNALIHEDLSLEEKFARLVREIPQLEEELEKFSHEQKKVILQEAYTAKLKECESLYTPSLSDEKKALLNKKYDLYAKALTLLRQDLWEDLYNYWHSNR